jgi:hypothetical protein
VKPHTATSGKVNDAQPMDVRVFTKAFIAALVDRGLVEIRPHEETTRRGFAAVINSLDTQADTLFEQRSDVDVGRQIMRVSNALRASNTGAFDGFESALRQVQLTFTSSPNPDYDEIAFSVPRVYARAVIAGLAPVHRAVIETVVRNFIAASDEGRHEPRGVKATSTGVAS